jgi:hypothetical protein
MSTRYRDCYQIISPGIMTQRTACFSGPSEMKGRSI